MSKKGENIFKRRDGRWEARYVKGRRPDGKLHYGYCYGKSYKEAKEKMLSVIANPAGNTSLTEQLNFESYCQNWLINKKHSIKESTLSKYETIVIKHLIPRFGCYYPSLIPLDYYNSYTDYLFEQGLSAKTIKDILTVLRGILNYISKTNDIGNIPSLITFPKVKSKECEVISNDKEKQLLRFLLDETDRIKLGIAIALLTGIRVGELAALKEENIDIVNEHITISSTMERIYKINDTTARTKIIITDPKSEKSKRIIPLPKPLLDLIKPWITGNPQAYFTTGVEFKFVEPRVLQYTFKKIAAKCGIENPHFHMLRHTFATRCVELGFDVKTLSEILGHSSPRITLERYVHSSYLQKQENMTKLSVFLS